MSQKILTSENEKYAHVTLAYIGANDCPDSGYQVSWFLPRLIPQEYLSECHLREQWLWRMACLILGQTNADNCFYDVGRLSHIQSKKAGQFLYKKVLELKAWQDAVCVKRKPRDYKGDWLFYKPYPKKCTDEAAHRHRSEMAAPSNTPADLKGHRQTTQSFKVKGDI